MKKWIMLVVLLMLLVWQVPAVKADEVSELKKMLAEQSLLLKQMENRLNKLETKQADQQEMVKKEVKKEVAKVSQAQATTTGLPASLDWATKIKLSGDLRYRHETIEHEGDTSQDRHRNRIRFRLGLSAKVNDEWKVKARMVTGDDDPVSTNQTLDGAFTTKDFRLDRAYAQWNPECVDGFTMMFGKFGVPFYKPGKTELIFDGDLSVEGIAADKRFVLDDGLKAWATAGSLWVDERSGSNDAMLWGVQGGLDAKLNDNTSLKGGVSYYGYSELKGNAVAIGAFGNNATGGTYDEEFELVEVFGELGTKVGDMPVSVFYDYVVNTADSTGSEDDGYLVGCKLNKAKKPGTWEFKYNYREIDPDATLGVVTDSDFNGGGTNGKGHEFGFKYALAKNLFAGISYFLTEDKITTADDDYRRLQIDLMYKF